MFGGLGDVVHELRELIKDLWYRNRIERRLLELELRERESALGCGDRHDELPVAERALPSGDHR